MSASWHTLIQAALRCPSPHNTQPWRIKIRDGAHATLFMERARTLPDEDVTGQFLRCAMGLFLESLSLLAANANYHFQYSLAEDHGASDQIKFAEMELVHGAEVSSYPNELFQKRLTSRLASNGVLIDPVTETELKTFGQRDGYRYDQINDPVLIEKIIAANIRAVNHDLNVPAYHDEIFRWFRYSDEEARTMADGLDYRCMGVPSSQLKLMKSLPGVMKWPLIRSLIWKTYRRQIGKVSHLGVISGPFFNDASSVHAGGYLMRFWLKLAAHNLHIHPFGNLVTNAEASCRVKELTGMDNVWLVFRIGHTDAPPQSYRRSLHDILIP